MTFKEAVDKFAKIAGDQYHTVAIDHTVNSRGESNMEYKLYLSSAVEEGGSGKWYSGRSWEDAFLILEAARAGLALVKSNLEFEGCPDE